MLSQQESAIVNYLLTETDDLLCFCNADDTIIKVNKLFADLLNRDANHLTGKHLSTFFTDEESELSNFLKLSQNQNIDNQEYISNIKNKDGSLIPVSWKVSSLQNIKILKGTILKSILLPSSERDKITAIADSLSDCFFVFDARLNILFRNKAAITKFTHPLLKDDLNCFFGSFSEETNMRFAVHFKTALINNIPLKCVEFSSLLNTWFCIEVIGFNNELNIIATDISDKVLEHKTNELELKTFEMNIEKKYALEDILTFLIKGFENLYPFLSTCILRVENQKIWHLCSARLPATFGKAIQGLDIGPTIGSCGSAVFYKKNVITENIETDPNWVGINKLVLSEGYKSCWSFPIISNKNLEVMATFAAYGKENRKPTESENKSIARICNIIKIIFEDLKHDDDLLLSNNRYKTVTMATNDAIYEWDLKTKKVYWSENIYNIFGFTIEEVEKIKNWWKNSIHPEDVDDTIKRLKVCLSKKESGWTAEYRLKCKNGLYKYVYDRAYIIYDNKNEPLTIIGAIQDISILKEREIEILKQNNKLKEIAQISSHDLRRPVTSILGLTNLFNVNNLADENNLMIIDYLQKATKELDDVIHDIVAKTLEADHSIYHKHTKIRN